MVLHRIQVYKTIPKALTGLLNVKSLEYYQQNFATFTVMDIEPLMPLIDPCLTKTNWSNGRTSMHS